MSRRAKYALAVAAGWTVVSWMDAGDHNFSSGSRDVAIGWTILWFVLGVGVVIRGRSERRHEGRSSGPP
jgi:hypothetical protein